MMNLNRILSILIFAFSITTSCTNNPKFDISGTWNGFSRDSTNFSINLEQIDDKIGGTYCAVTNNGDFIDCWLEDDYNQISLNGSFIDGVFKVQFDIAYTTGQGFATITYNETQEILTWKLDSSTNITYCPKEINLKTLFNNSHSSHRLCANPFAFFTKVNSYRSNRFNSVSFAINR
jgi:hypothetical protein